MGPACIIQSDYKGNSGHGNFEVVVPVRNTAGGMDLHHWVSENDDSGTRWFPAGNNPIVRDVVGPGCIVQSDFQGESGHGNFELVVPVRRPGGVRLEHWFSENDDNGTNWKRGRFVTESSAGGACIITSDYGSPHRNLEVLTEECPTSIVGYFHDSSDVALPWLRDKPLLGEPAPTTAMTATRLYQLTGVDDRNGWNGQGTPPRAANADASERVFHGTDLGVSFQHRERTWFLFGDTWRVDQPDGWTNLDMVAWTNDSDGTRPLQLTFR
jgi:hypothetical protein